VTYETAQALRTALERRLLNRSKQTGVALDRLRRRVLFERVVARLEAANPGRWVLKGGMALDVRLRDKARLTKDIDLGLRDDVNDPRHLHDQIARAFDIDGDRDRFVLSAAEPEQLVADDAGRVTWRVRVAAELAGKPFGGIGLDVSPRAHELERTELVTLPNLLEFAGIPAPVIEIIDIQRHGAEKFHAMLRDYGDRDNTRVRDLVDIVLLIEHDELEPSLVGEAVTSVWAERDGAKPPRTFPALPPNWPHRYEQLATENGLTAKSFDDAVILVERLWADMFPREEG
jgi:hypothetical protein